MIMKWTHLNRSFADSDISPLKPSKISDQNMSTYAKRKLSQYESALPGKMAKLLDVDPDQLMKTKEPQPCSNCKGHGPTCPTRERQDERVTKP